MKYSIQNQTAIKGDLGDDNRPYIDGDPAHGISGSIPPADAIEHPMREIMNVIEGAGLTPDGEDLTQLDKAIRALILAGELQPGANNTWLHTDKDGQIGWEEKAAVSVATTTEQGISRIVTAEEILSGRTGADGPAFLTLEQVMQLLSAIKPLWPIGWMEMVPFRNSELPDGWYFMNGDRYTLSGPQGQALNGLPPNYKSDWGITVSGDTINVPKFFYVDGRGYFIRAMNGTNRQVGSHELDAMQNIKGSVLSSSYGFGAACGGFSGTGPFGIGAMATRRFPGCAYYPFSGETEITFESSRSVRTASETRVLDVGMTPAIYLGV